MIASRCSSWAPCSASSAGRKAPARAATIACRAQAQPQQQQSLASHLLACGAAISIMLAPTQAHSADYATLADTQREAFGFVDRNKDGVITLDEMSALSQEIAEEQDFDAPREQLLSFTMRVFDLNQDGKTTADEMLTGLALDRAVGDDAIDSSIVEAFDRNSDGRVDLGEFKAPFGSLGEGGEQLKEFTFKRVKYLSEEGSRGQGLDTTELANALILMRVMTLGY